MKLLYSSIILLLLSSGFISGCASSLKQYNYTVENGASERLLMKNTDNENQAYMLYQNAYKDEMAKVFYLINSVRFSKNTFMRNGKTYSGDEAAEWLEYKVNKFHDEIETVEDFVEKVGSYSRKSGQPYSIVYDDGAQVPVKTAYYNQLHLLSNITIK